MRHASDREMSWTTAELATHRHQDAKKVDSFEEFWPYYLAQHARPITRRMHLIGTTLGLASALLLTLKRDRYAIPAGLVAGYGFAWFAHFAFERNLPASYGHPLWSARADFKMYWGMITGRLRIDR